MESDDDPFDLKASARKLKPIRESIVNTARLVDIEDQQFVDIKDGAWPISSFFEIFTKFFQLIKIKGNAQLAQISKNFYYKFFILGIENHQKF